ncbi:MAG: YitT family protein [Lachnospiraceae bacterium]|nr:YitT family protein [Lachnospiraceae bacterium]
MGNQIFKENKAVRLALQTAIILTALIVYAAGVVLFILPLNMIAAGSTGLALIVQHLWGIPLSAFLAVFNVLMFLWGFWELGKEFALSTLIATLFYPLALEQVGRLLNGVIITRDPMLCAIFSGLLIGASLGTAIRAGASTGGLDIPPLVLKKKLGLPVSATMYVIDFSILLIQMAFGEPERILYGLIMVMMYTIVLDKVLVLGVRQTQVKIMSSRYEEISRLIQEKMDRGTTLLYTEGGHSRKESRAVLTVVSGRELQKLNALVMGVDDSAFMIVNQVGEVRGRGFTLRKKYE